MGEDVYSSIFFVGVGNVWVKLRAFFDLCDVGSFVHYEHEPPFELGAFGTAVVRAIQSGGLWHSCAGIFN